MRFLFHRLLNTRSSSTEATPSTTRRCACWSLIPEKSPSPPTAGAVRCAATPHGTGCALSTDIACLLGLGRALREAVTEAHARMQKRIAAAHKIGKGRAFLGPAGA